MKMSCLFSLLQELSNQQGRNYWGGGGGGGGCCNIPQRIVKRRGGPGMLELRNVLNIKAFSRKLRSNKGLKN